MFGVFYLVFIIFPANFGYLYCHYFYLQRKMTTV
nr:MAG TPA: hypothetical protein [Bacteriophage sp.]